MHSCGLLGAGLLHFGHAAVTLGPLPDFRSTVSSSVCAPFSPDIPLSILAAQRIARPTPSTNTSHYAMDAPVEQHACAAPSPVNKRSGSTGEHPPASVGRELFPIAMPALYYAGADDNVKAFGPGMKPSGALSKPRNSPSQPPLTMHAHCSDGTSPPFVPNHVQYMPLQDWTPHMQNPSEAWEQSTSILAGGAAGGLDPPPGLIAEAWSAWITHNLRH